MSIDFESICMNTSKFLFEAPEVKLFLNDTNIRVNIFYFSGKGLFWIILENINLLQLSILHCC